MGRFPRSLLPVALIASLAGCPPGNGTPPPPAEKTGSIDAKAGPHTTTTIATTKNGKPFVLVDMGPELPALAGWAPASQTEYLKRRALMLARAAAAGELAGKPEYTVRMIVLTTLDEYGRPRWDAAPELARFEVTLPPAEVDPATLGEAQLAPHFKAAELKLETLSATPAPTSTTTAPPG